MRSGKINTNYRAVLPWAAAVLILVGGYMSVSLIKPLLPDYRDEVVSFEKAERNSPIYLQGNDSIAIYPWNEYDEAELITLEEYLLQATEQSRPGVSDPEGADREVPDSEKVKTVFREMSDFLAPWVIIEDGDMDGLIQSVTCEVAGEVAQYYLKDFAIDSSGEEYLAGLFFDVENRGFFYHYQNVDAERVSSTQINEAQETIKRSIEEIGELYQQWMVYEYKFVIDGGQLSELMRENPMIRAWYRMVVMSQGMEMDFMADILTGMAYVLYQAAQGGGNVELVVYQGELLAIFADDFENRIVVFYDPVQKEVSGLSVRIGQLSK
ncbi:MAG: hypothetical protein IJZ85_01840 [Lachnospiraceae bacterium]|nr:hypothetical protein [Lachnospiraceae bacterium]